MEADPAMRVPYAEDDVDRCLVNSPMRALKRHPLPRLDLQEAYDWYEDQSRGLGTELERDFKNHIQALPEDAALYAVRFADVRRAES